MNTLQETPTPGTAIIIYDSFGYAAAIKLFPFYNDQEDSRSILQTIREFGQGNISDGIFLQKFNCKDISSLSAQTTEEVFVYLANHSKTLPPKIYLPDLLFVDQKYSIDVLSDFTITQYIKAHYSEYLDFLTSKNIQKAQPQKSDFTDNFERCRETLKFRAERFNFYDIFTPDFLPENLNNQQLETVITDLYSYRKNSRDNLTSGNIELVEAISVLPDRFKSSALRPFVGEQVYSYYLVTHEDSFNPKEAFAAMQLYALEKLSTKWDSVGGMDEHGVVTGCEIEIYPSLQNPALFFPAELLSTQEWRSIVDINVNMVNHIPSEILQKEEFWRGYENLLGKGKYLLQPANVLKYNHFDENEILAKMPEKLKNSNTVKFTFNLRKIETDPDYFQLIPEKDRTPELCLYLSKLHPTFYNTHKDLIPAKILRNTNIFSFSLKLEGKTIDEIQKLYNNKAQSKIYVKNIDRSEIQNKTRMK